MQLYELGQKITDKLIEYWWQFSSFDSWQFWVTLAMLVVPLIVLYFLIDRSQVFKIGFFGLCVHIVTTYADLTGWRLGYWDYPYFAIPLFPVALGLDSSLIPVVFMLLYQWVTEKNRNFYLYAVILAALFAFGLKPLMNTLDLFRLHKGLSFLELFLYVYVPIIFLSKWLFNTFVFLENQKGKYNHPGNE
ncbi:MAG TPA: CBO0543 family protein [Candidatus Bathyarchaeia archaeon]|nr:CBO0543 family protein [Candidatus Bathyarchaeia archaeon]